MSYISCLQFSSTQRLSVNQRKASNIHDTHGQYQKMPKLTPAELSRMKYEKEAREQQDLILARRRHEELARQAMMQRDPRLQAAAAVAGVCVIISFFLEYYSDGELLATPTGSGSGDGGSSSSPATTAKWDAETSSPARASCPANTESARGAGQHLSAAENANTNGINGRCRGSYISSALVAGSSRPSSCNIYRCSRTGSSPSPSTGTR